MTFSLSNSLAQIVNLSEDEQLYTFEYAAQITEILTTTVQIYIELGVIEPIGDRLRAKWLALRKSSGCVETWA